MVTQTRVNRRRLLARAGAAAVALREAGVQLPLELVELHTRLAGGNALMRCHARHNEPIAHE